MAVVRSPGGPGFLSLLAVALVLLGQTSHAAPAPDTSGARVDFNFRIRPLLSDRCFACHGPDDKSRKGGLDLHLPAAALRGGKSGKPSIAPGRPDDSELVRRLLSQDPDEMMPPRESKLPPLTAAEIEDVRRWISQGAEYKEHWAFLPISRPPPPKEAQITRSTVSSGPASPRRT